MTQAHGNGEERLRYGVEDNPDRTRTALYAFQHVLTMLPATVAVPLLISSEARLSPHDTVAFISAVLISMGVATVMQVRFGSRLPVVQGSAFAFIPSMYLIAQVAATHPDDRYMAIKYISGSLLLGGLLQFGIGYTQLIGPLRRIFGPVVTGPVIIVIGLTLFQVAAQKAGSNWIVAGVTIVMVFVLAYGTLLLPIGRARTWMRTLPILLTTATGVVIYYALVGLHLISGAEASRSIETVNQADWIVHAWWPSTWWPPVFDFTVLVATLAAVLAATMDSIGNYHACSEAARADGPTPEQLNNGVAVQGLSSMIGALLGGVGNTGYSENVAVIWVTRIASRRVILWAGCALIGLGIFPKISAILSAIPSPVMGGLYCVLFGMIVGIGLQHVGRANLSSSRDVLIMGFAIFMGLSVPAYVHANADDIRQVTVLFLGEVFYAIGSTGVGVTAVLAICLHYLLPEARSTGADRSGILAAVSENQKWRLHEGGKANEKVK